MTFRHRAVAKLADAIVALEKSTAKKDVDARVQIGGMLSDLREMVAHGEWLRWLDSDVPLSPRTAQLHMSMHAWAQTHQVIYPRLSALGASKFLLLMRQPGKVLASLLKAQRLRVPGGGKLRTLEGTTFGELLAVVKKRGGGAALSPATRALSGYRRRVNALVRATSVLVEHAGELPPDDVRALADALRDAAAALEAEL